MVTGAVALGGAERQMYSLVQGLLQRGWSVEVMELIGVAPGQASFEEEFKKAGVSVRRASGEGSLNGHGIPDGLEPFAPLVPGNLAQICRSLRDAMRNFGRISCTAGRTSRTWSAVSPPPALI